MGPEFLKLFKEYLFDPSVVMTVGAIEPEWFDAFFQRISHSQVYGFSGNLNAYHRSFQKLLPWIQSQKLHWELAPLEFQSLKDNLSDASFSHGLADIAAPACGFLDDYCQKAQIP
ncbi:MAG: hypothetical protein K2X66_11770, partial [Cyanobacteria bacterium]|nr:hypothetical protein [Cyanobacteriota bacterium]